MGESNMKETKTEEKQKKVEKIAAPKRVQTAEGKRRALLRDSKTTKKRAA